MNTWYSVEKSSTYFIDSFKTNKDPYNTRENYYFDVRYGELKISFNENRVIIDLTFNVAGTFNLPPGCITADVVLPGQTVGSISLFRQQNKIPADFLYGFPDASSIYAARIILDSNEDKFLSSNENSSYQIVVTFGINSNSLGHISVEDIKPNILSEFISNINNTSLKFNVNLYQKNEFDLDRNFVSTANQIHSIWVSSQVKELDNTITYGSQKNNYLPFQFIGYDYRNFQTPIKDIFNIKKLNNTSIKIEVKKFKIRYYLENKLYETNEIEINNNVTISSNFYTFSLKDYQLSYNELSNSYKLEFGDNGIFFDDNISGSYLITVKATIDGSSRTYILKNSFNFVKTSKLNISFESNLNDLKILDSDIYYEIKE